MQLNIDHITVKGFKSLRSVEKLELRPINVLIGSNGSGKSNFIGMFSFLRDIREGRLQNYVTRSGGAGKILHFGSKTTKQIEIDISFKEGINAYNLLLAPSDNDSLYPIRETVSFWDKRYPGPYVYSLASINRGLEAGISSSEQTSRVAGWVRSRLDSWRLYHVHDTSSTSPMRTASEIQDNKFLRPDGSNLPSFLFYLHEKESTSYNLIRRTIQQVAPFFDDFLLAPSNLNPDTIRLEWKHKNSDQFFDASSLSDGSLRFITLATLFLQPVKLLPSLILVDEPELGLHPYAVQTLASLVRNASKHTQILIATQSSQLLDNFDPEDVLVADRVDGGTNIKRVEGGRLNSWLEEYSLGQLWEKNEFAGRPSSEQ
jgi:predicted ATPase